MTISCQTEAIPEVLQFNWMWKHNGTVVAYGPTIYLRDLRMVDSGLYECIGSNYMGTKANSIIVNVLCKYSKLYHSNLFENFAVLPAVVPLIPITG